MSDFVREVTFIFDTVAEANAFCEGVLFVNDEDIQPQDVLVGTIDGKPSASVICLDSVRDGEDKTYDFRH